MTESVKKETAKVGDLAEKAKAVIRPNGESLVVSGGYVYDVPGTHVVDGAEVEAK